MKLRETLNSVLGTVLVILMASMVINVLLQVFARYLSISMPFTEELAGFLLMWVGLLGASYATGKRLHLAIDLMPRKATLGNQKKFNVIVNALVFLFALSVMVIGGARLVYIALTLNQTSPVMEIPKGFIYTVLPISGLLIMVYSILNLRENPYESMGEAVSDV